MKRIILFLTAALMVFAFSLGAAEEPEAEPAEEWTEETAEEPVSEEIPGEESIPEDEISPQDENEVPWEETSGDGEIPEEEETPGEETPEEETPGEEPAPEEPAEEPGEETLPAEEEMTAEAGCAHEHTETVYYFDAPEYRPLNDETHLVTGQAVEEVTCLDCGVTLSLTTVNDAEEIRPHVFRNGMCVLCGREAVAEETAPAATESVIPLAAGKEPDQYSCTLTGADLADKGDTLVLRPEGREAAIAVQTERLREEIERAGGRFTATIWKPGDRDVSTTLCLYDANGEEVVPVAQGFTLRIYTGNPGTPLTVSYTNLHGATSFEEARWVKNNGDEGYWIVTWLGDGLYEYCY